MGEIAFVGTGLADEGGLSRRALDRLRSAGRLFAEEYTATLVPGSLDRLEGMVGRPIERLDRAQVESADAILKALATEPTVAFLVAGDPFAATTHVALRVAAERAGHRWTYVPGPSIHTAAASLLGLMHYKFGRTVSIPFADPGFAPTSFLDGIMANLSIGAHSLVLLDLRPDEGRFMTANEGLRLLRERDADHRVATLDRAVAVVARVGRDDADAWFGRWGDLEAVDVGPPLHAVVVPALPFHFQEEEAIARFRWPRGR